MYALCLGMHDCTRGHALSFFYVCMVNTIYLLSFVETPRKFIIAELSSYYYSTDEDPSLRIESSAIINLRGVSTKLNKYRIYILLICGFRGTLLPISSRFTRP